MESQASYEIWAIGYDIDGNLIGFEKYLGEYKLADKAIKKASKIKFTDLEADLPVGSIIQIEVESVVDGENQETIYMKRNK